MEHLDGIKKILDKFNEFYWNSEMVNNISLIDDLRLSRNIHETAHSRILYKFLRAHTHEEPFLFLKCFLKKVGLKNLYLDFKNVKVYVEYKNIDVLITDGEKRIIIENKVNHAFDQDRQLSRYIKLNAGYDVYVLYLVRNQTDEGPSDNSLPNAERNKMEENGHFRKISYQVHILNWLNLCKRVLCQGPSLLGSALIQYSNFLEKIIKNETMMDEKDAKAFEEKFLGFNDERNPLELNDRVEKLYEKIDVLKGVVYEYEVFLKKRYLEYFKKQTGLSNAILNSSRQIEFVVSIDGIEVPFIYDFLKTPPASYVWFGTPREHIENNVSLFSSYNSENKDKILARLKDIPSKYRIEDKDNADSCESDKFRPFYSDSEWNLCKYCEDNYSAIHDIKMYLGWMSKGKDGDI